MEESRRRFVAAVTAGITGSLAGCGGGDGATPTEGAAATDTPTETASAVEMPTTTAEAAQVVAVAADGFSFSPASFEIQAGDTVRWEWEAGGHNVKADTVPEGSDWIGTPGDERFSGGHTYSYTFDTAGEYSYYCDPHRSAGMTGSFTVAQQ